MYTEINRPHFVYPIGNIHEYGNGLYRDDNDNIFQMQDGKYLKVGCVLNIQNALVNNVVNIGLAIVLFQLFFPRNYGNRDTGSGLILLRIIAFMAACTFAYAVFIGWLVSKLYTSNVDRIINFLEKHRIARLFVPAYWFGRSAKIIGMIHLGLPIFLILTPLSYILANGNTQGFWAISLVLNFFSLIVSVICLVLDLLYNLLAKVNKY